MPNKKTTPQKTLSEKHPIVSYDDALSMMHNISTLVSRATLSWQLGKGFEGERKYYEVFGYPQTVTYPMLYNVYERDGIGGRAADGIAQESWRKPPIVKDGNVKWYAEEEEAEGDTENELTPFLTGLADFNDRHNIFSLLMEADKMLGYSRFAAIYIGAPGKPEDEITTLNTKDIAYFEVLDEGEAIVSSWVTDNTDPRYGLPTKYSINYADQRMGVSAHWSRIVHLKEGKEKGSRYYGKARLVRPYNYILDLQKVLGGSAEAFWLLVRKGLALIAREGVDMPQPGTAEYEGLQDEIDEYEHQLRRVLRLRGMDIQDLGSEVPNPDPQFRILVSALAGTLETPQRILVGSEAGQLASSQDDKNFADVIASRLRNLCYPKMARVFIQKLIDLKAIPAPASGKFKLIVPPLFELTPTEKAQVAGSVASSIATFTGGSPEMGMTIEDYMEKFHNYRKPAGTEDRVYDRLREEAEVRKGLIEDELAPDTITPQEKPTFPPNKK